MPTTALLFVPLLALAPPRPPPQEVDAHTRSPLTVLRPDAAEQAAPEAPPLSRVATKLDLSLESCVRTVLQRNLSLKIDEIQNAQTAASVMEALGSFDPELYATATGSDSEQPTASSFTAPKNQNLTGRAGIRGLLPSGLLYDLGYNVDYNRQSPTNPFFGLNPSVSSSLGIALTQPLLRGFGSTVTESPVEQARLLVARGDLDLYTRVQEVAFQAVEAYWNLVKARRERDTASEALAVADELVTNNTKRKDAGVMTRLDVLTAAAEAARRKEALIRAVNAVGRAEDAVKLLLSPGVALGDWNVLIEPTTPASLDEVLLPDEQSAIVAAFTERSDLRALEVDLRSADLSLAVAQNQELPKLDLLGSYGYAGLAGKQPGGASKNNVDLWGNSLEAIRDRDFKTWSIGLDFSRPIGNRSARAVERKAELAKESAYMSWLSLRMTIVQEIRGALRDVADAKAATEASREARVLAEEQYQAELVRLENQHSTTFQVRESQRDLFEAQDAETLAIVQYEILLAALERSRGRLAQQYGVEWELTARPEGARAD